MNTERLKHLIEVMEKVLDEERPFDISLWINTQALPLDENRSYIVPLLDVPAHQCGTAACALGWATRDPEFRKQGLTFDPDVCTPLYIDGEHHWRWEDAGAAFFGITSAQAEYLFFASGYDVETLKEVTPDRVIEHIHDLLDGRYNPPGSRVPPSEEERDQPFREFI